MIRSICPNCECQWGIEEMDWNHCSACGWPDNEDEDNEEQFFDDSDLTTQSPKTKK